MRRKLLLVVTLLFAATLFAPGMPLVIAADTNLADGVTVDSKGDGPDASAGDGQCNDGSGNCTLRAAIEEANAFAGTQTILFNISGVADFTVNGQNGYTITPSNLLPDITQPIIMNGVSQSGATCGTSSTARALLIEIDGTSVSGSGLTLSGSSSGSTIRGLVINNQTTHGISDQSSGGNTFACNHLGTDPAGLVAASNTVNGLTLASSSNGNTIGGTANTNPGGPCRGDCNLLSGNLGSGIIIFSDNNNMYGNYVCTNANGTGAIPNGATNGDGAISIEPGGDGNAVGNGSPAGRNVVSGCSGPGGAEGVNVMSSNNTVRGNYFGVDTTGLNDLGSNGPGVVISDQGGTTSGNVIGGTTESDRNVISGNTSTGSNLAFFSMSGGATGNFVRGNYIGTNANGVIDAGFTQNIAVGVMGAVSNNVVGGTAPGSGNLIAGSGTGVGVYGLSGFSLTPSNNSILGNSIYDNNGGSISALGIDIFDDTSGDFVPDTNVGVTANDANDVDSGPNNYQNTPVINNVSASGNSATITYSLDVNDSEVGATGYRVEFFANTSADPSGSGEGQYYLGSQNVSGDVSNQVVTLSNLNVPNGNYVLSATTTATDASSDGFGSTSEFSLVSSPFTVLASATSSPASSSSPSTSTDGLLANTGQSALVWLLVITAAVILPARYVLINWADIHKRYRAR